MSIADTLSKIAQLQNLRTSRLRVEREQQLNCFDQRAAATAQYQQLLRRELAGASIYRTATPESGYLLAGIGFDFVTARELDKMRKRYSDFATPRGHKVETDQLQHSWEFICCPDSKEFFKSLPNWRCKLDLSPNSTGKSLYLKYLESSSSNAKAYASKPDYEQLYLKEQRQRRYLRDRLDSSQRMVKKIRGELEESKRYIQQQKPKPITYV